MEIIKTAPEYDDPVNEKGARKNATVQTNSLPSRIETITSEGPNSPCDSDDDIFYPEGGVQAWLQVLSGFLCNCVAWGYATAFGIYQLHYTQTLHLPNAQVAWIGSVQTFLTFGACYFSGRVVDAGHPKLMIRVGTFMAVLGSFMTSVATEYWQIFLAQGVCTGLGLGIMFMPGVAVVSSYFNKKRNLALSCTAFGTSCGAVIFPATVQYLIPQVGFAWATRVAAFVAMFLCGVLNIIFRPRTDLPSTKPGPWIEWTAFKDPAYLIFAWAGFFYFWGLFFVTTYVNTYAVSFLGFSNTDSVVLLLLVNAAGGPPRPLIGWLADRYSGPINAFILIVALLSVLSYAWMAVWTRPAMYTWAIIYGAINGASQGIFPGALASWTKDESKQGSRFGMACSFVAFATLAGPPTAGAIIDNSGGEYKWAQVWGGSIIALGALAAVAARWYVVGWKVVVKV